MKVGGLVPVVVLFLNLIIPGCSDDQTLAPGRRYSARSDTTFAVGDSSSLEVSNFAGSVVVTPGLPGVVNVAVEKWAWKEASLDSIDVAMVELANGVRIVTTNPSKVSGVSVDLELSIPSDMRPNLATGAGDLEYEGSPEGEQFFVAGAGTINLKLPADVNAEVHLTVGSGSIEIEFPVVGQVSEHLVDGVIGSGEDGRIVAQVGAGRIIVSSQ